MTKEEFSNNQANITALQEQVINEIQQITQEYLLLYIG